MQYPTMHFGRFYAVSHNALGRIFWLLYFCDRPIFPCWLYINHVLFTVSRYYRTINFGIPKELRHKSTVDCDFRPRARGFSETTWIFPKKGRDIYKSTLERQQLVDMTWYKSKVSYLSAQDSATSPTESATEKVIMEYSSNDEGVFETENQNGAYSSSEEGEEHHPTIINNNNNKQTKASIDSIDNDSMSLSSVENDLISP